MRARCGEARAFMERSFKSENKRRCIEWPFATVEGYAVVQIDGKLMRVSRVFCRRRNGLPPSRRHEAAHSCGKRGCINKYHVRWATHSENEQDKRRHGTRNDPFGERHGMSRLIRSQVATIRRRVADGEMQSALAAELGLSRTHVSQIVRRTRWRHV